MSTKEVKEEIQKILDTVPEEVLYELLDFLKTAQNQSHDQVSLSINLKKILSEDKELLERLAQ